MAAGAAYSIPFEYKYHGIVLNEQEYPPDNVDRARDIELRKGDVLILSYPRTGTTLLCHTVSLLLCEDQHEIERQENIILNKRVPYLERNNPADDNQITNFINQSGSRLLQSHLPSYLSKQWWERDTGAQVVSILRNPKDALVSLYHFYKGMTMFGPFPGNWDDFFALYQSGSMLYGDCVDWSLAMWSLRQKPNIRVLFYEDLLKSPQAQLRKLADFLQVDRSDAMMNEVMTRTSFQTMKTNPATNYTHKEFKGFEFVRRGQIGDWKNYFTPEQNEWMDEYLEKKLDGSDLTFQFE